MPFAHLIRQKMYERLVAVVRRHPITFIPNIILFLFLLLVPVGAYWAIGNSFAHLFTDPVWAPILVMVASLYYLFICLFFYTNFVVFYLDVWVITTDRLLDIQQKSLFARTMAELDLYQIQDATSEVKGFFASFFNYGDLTIQTAAAKPQFKLTSVRDPHGLRQKILDLAAADRIFHNREENK